MPTLLTVHCEYINKSVRCAIFLAAFLTASTAYSECITPSFDAPLGEQLAALPDCQRNAQYLARIGHLLNQSGQYGEAAEHLERALMLEPSLAAAQLDYAIALAGAGDSLSASQLLDSILSQPDIPTDLRVTLTNAKTRIAATQNQPALTNPQQFPLRITANVRYGRDSNLLGTANISSLALTTPAGIVVLPLADNSGPRSGAYTRSDVKLEYTFSQSGVSRWDLAATALDRISHDVPDSNFRQTELALSYTQTPRDSWATYANTSYVSTQTEGGTRYKSQSLTAGVQAPQLSNACSVRAGLDWQSRIVTSNSLLSGYYTGLSSTLACAAGSGGQLQIISKLGHDRPQEANRPGGSQILASVRGIGVWMMSGLGVKGTVLLDVEHTSTRDTTGYSALLNDSTVRSTRRTNMRVEYQRPISQHLLATLGAEWSNQSSNLELFRVHGWGPYAALRLAW